METFQIPRTGLPDLIFQGRLMAQARGLAEDPATGSRRHDIAVYQAEDGEYIVSIQYHTSATNESPDAYVETARCPEDVEAVLSLYDPTERIVLQDAGESNSTRSMPAVLTRNYDLQVLQILEQLRGAVQPVAVSS